REVMETGRGDRPRRGRRHALRAGGRAGHPLSCDLRLSRLGAAHEEGDQDRPARLLPVQAQLAIRLTTPQQAAIPSDKTQVPLGLRSNTPPSNGATSMNEPAASEGVSTQPLPLAQ